MTKVPRAAPGEPTVRQVEAAMAEGIRAAVISLVVSAGLAVVKIGAGVVGNSYALIADGLESTFDVFSGLLVWSGFRISGTPPTADFPYGRGRAEQLSALAISTMLLAAAAGIAIGAVREILVPHSAPAAFTLPVLLVVVAVKESTFRILMSKGRRLGSRSLTNDAWHHRSDAITSLAAMVGISIALVGGDGYESADDWAALLACGVIVWNAGRLFRGAAHDLLDAAAPDAVQHRIRELAKGVEGVAGVDDLRVRRSGLAFWVDIHVEVDGAMPVRRGHEIAHQVKDRLVESELPVLDALVHVEPVRTGMDGPESGSRGR